MTEPGGEAVSVRACQLLLPGTCRADKKARPPKRSEKALQSQIRQALGTLGYETLEAGNGRRQVRCPHGAYFYPRGWQGNSVGFPDLACIHDEWPAGFALFFEVKADLKSDVRPEQAELARRRRVIIVCDIAKPIGELVWVENLLRLSGYWDRGGTERANARATRLTAFLRENAGRLG